MLSPQNHASTQVAASHPSCSSSHLPPPSPHLPSSSSCCSPAALLALSALMAPRITALLSAPGAGPPRLARLHLSARLPRRLGAKLRSSAPPLGMPAEPEPGTGGELTPSTAASGVAGCCCCLLPPRSSWRTTGSSALLLGRALPAALLLGVAEQLVPLPLPLLQREKLSVSLQGAAHVAPYVSWVVHLVAIHAQSMSQLLQCMGGMQYEPT
jgi:hypothetical protein